MWFFLIGLLNVFFLLFLPWLVGVPYWLHLPTLLLYYLWVPRESKAFRSFRLWDYMFERHTTGKPLPSNEQCIYAIHPHGVFSVSTIIYFALNKNMVHVKPVGSSVLFLFGLIKEFCGLAGTIRANRKDIIAALQCGDSVAMCPGGLRELPGLDPQRVKEGGGVVQREGFVKIAKGQNVPVVPVWCSTEEAQYKVWLWSPRIQRLLLGWFYYPGFVVSWGLWWMPFWPKTNRVVLHFGKPIKAEDLTREVFYKELETLKKGVELVE